MLEYIEQRAKLEAKGRVASRANNLSSRVVGNALTFKYTAFKATVFNDICIQNNRYYSYRSRYNSSVSYSKSNYICNKRGGSNGRRDSYNCRAGGYTPNSGRFYNYNSL